MARMINISEFKERCNELLDEMKTTGEALTLTEDGKPVAEVTSVSHPKARPLFGMLAGRAEILGDIIEPIDVEWNANNGKI